MYSYRIHESRNLKQARSKIDQDVDLLRFTRMLLPHTQIIPQFINFVKIFKNVDFLEN